MAGDPADSIDTESDTASDTESDLASATAAPTADAVAGRAAVPDGGVGAVTAAETLPVTSPLTSPLLSPLLPRPRLWPVFVTFVVALVAILILGGVAMAAAFGIPWDGDVSRYTTLPALLLSSVVTSAVLFGAGVIAARPRTGRGDAWQRLGLAGGWGTPGQLLAATAGTVALGWVFQVAMELLRVPVRGSLLVFAQAVQGTRGPLLLASVVAFGLLPGVSEEIFFRGFMQTRLAARWRPWVALLVTSACFGLVHLDPVHSPLAFVIGLWLGFVALKTNVRLAVVGHVTNNAVATLTAAIGLRNDRIMTGAMLVVFVVAAAQIAGFGTRKSA